MRPPVLPFQTFVLNTPNRYYRENSATSCCRKSTHWALQLLLDSGAKPSMKDKEGNLILHDLCSSENPIDFVQKLEKLLIDASSIRSFNKQGATPVLCALRKTGRADSKKLNKWEILNEFRKSSAGFEGMSSMVLMMEFWKELNAGRILRMWRRGEKIPPTPLQRWTTIEYLSRPLRGSKTADTLLSLSLSLSLSLPLSLSLSLPLPLSLSL